jgi:hypothetical protein
LHRLPNLTSLALVTCESPLSDDSIAQFVNLRSLELQLHEDQSISNAAISGLTNLRSLVLSTSGAGLAGIDAEALKTLTHLTRIGFGVNMFTFEQISRLTRLNWIEWFSKGETYQFDCLSDYRVFSENLG